MQNNSYILFVPLQVNLSMVSLQIIKNISESSGQGFARLANIREGRSEGNRETGTEIVKRRDKNK